MTYIEKHGHGKMISMMVVLMMLLMAFTIIAPSAESDADSSTYYRYEINYSGQTISSVKQFTSASDNTGTTATPVSSSSKGSWGFDSKGEYGPFNSFYAAIDTTTGKIAYHLNANDLTKTVSGDSLDNSGYKYNIMWILPTVYITATSSKLTLCSDSSSGGVPYAHMIGTRDANNPYKYLGYAVYEGYNDNGVLKSVSGVSPTASQTRAQFRTLATANNDNSDALGVYNQWNFFQWTLYKMCSYTVMGSKDSQATIGSGYTSGNSYSAKTGSTDAIGAYGIASSTTNSNGSSQTGSGKTSSKLFIENSWGSVYEWVDDVMFVDAKIYAGHRSVINDSTSEMNAISDTYYITGAKVSSSYKYGYTKSVYTDAIVWDLPSGYQSSMTSQTAPDYVIVYSGSRVLYVGGNWGSGPYAGVACAHASDGTSSSYANVGSRLAYVFDADPASTPTVTISSNNSEYGTVTTERITVSEANAPLTVNGNTVTIGTVGSVTAEPKPSTAEYTYRFSGWKLQNGDQLNNQTISGDLNIIAVFTATKNIYTVSLASNDSNYGGISSNSVSVEYGTAISSNGSTLSIGTNDIVATPTVSNAQYTYSFVDWSVNNGTVTGPMSITANFSRTINSYQITAQYSGDYGSVSPSSITAEYGSQIVSGANTLSIGSDTITFTPATGYTLDCWTLSDGSALPSTVTGPMTIIPNVIVRTITVTFMGGAGGSASELFEMATLKIPYGTTPMVFTPNLGDGVFQGWYTDSSLTQAFNTNTVLNDDLTLYCGATEYLKFTSSPIANGTLTTNSSLGMMIFDATGSESAYRVTWDFGDGTSSTDKVSYHMYTEPGRYKVTLSAYNYYGDVDVKEYTVVVSEGNNTDYTPIYVGVIIAVIIGLFIVPRII